MYLEILKNCVGVQALHFASYLVGEYDHKHLKTPPFCLLYKKIVAYFYSYKKYNDLRCVTTGVEHHERPAPCLCEQDHSMFTHL